MSLSPEEWADWGGNPDEWPHTPPLHVFRALYDADPHLPWRIPLGHVVNALEAALEALDDRDDERAGGP